jgi:hypothetical protein
MGDPVTTAAIVAGGATVGQAYLGGRQQRNQAKIQAAQLTTEQKALQTNAAIEQAERMRKLKTILAAQNAAFAMMGQTAGVGSAAAIQMDSLNEAAREQRIANLQTSIASKGLDYNIWSAKKASHLAVANAFVTAGLNTAARVGEAYVMGSFSQGGTTNAPGVTTNTQGGTTNAGGNK